MRKSDEICHFFRKMRASMPVVWYDKEVALRSFARQTKNPEQMQNVRKKPGD